MKKSSLLPHSPSIVDRLFAWMDRNRFPTWPNFVFLYLAILLITQANAWAEGTADLGEFESVKAVIAFFPTMTFAIIKYLDGVARIAASGFQPLREHDLEDYKNQVAELVLMPSKSVWILSLIGPSIALASFVFDLELIEFATMSLTSLVFQMFNMWIGLSPFPIFIYHTLRQLKLVSLIQSGAKELDLFNSTPLYSFSVLTSRTGMAWVVLLSSSLIFNMISGGEIGGLSISFFYAFLFFELTLAILSFVLPLSNLHREMEEAKSLIIDEINSQMKESIGKNKTLQKKLSEGQSAAHLNMAKAIETQRNYVKQLPTWPWKTETLRGFLSVILVPILLAVMQTLIERIL